MRTYRVNKDMWTELRDILVATPDEFNTDQATLRGRMVTVGLLSKLDQLPDEWRAVWHQDKDTMTYAIWSYDTPIAWRTYRNGKARWIMPDVKYSVTTSKHQGKVRTALSQISGGI